MTRQHSSRTGLAAEQERAGPSPRAIAEFETLFEKPPTRKAPEIEADHVDTVRQAPAVERDVDRDVDRPSSPFHVYEWVLEKLRANPTTTFLELCRRADLGRFTVSEGHYKRARRVVDEERERSSDAQIDALVEETLALLKRPLGELRQLRLAAREIAEICDEALGD